MKITQTTQFKKEFKKQKKRERDLQRLHVIIKLLASGEILPLKNQDHALSGNWLGWRDCHIEPDWLLLYKIVGDELILGRTGSHSDLF